MAEPHTGGMLALVPDNAEQLAVPDGEDAAQLHLTLLYLGDDVTGWPAGQADRLRELITASAPGLDAVAGRIVGHAVFNPDGYDDRDPCQVYLVGDTPDLEPLRKWAQWAMETGEDYASPPEQHTPFLPHVTAKYGRGAVLTYTGPVRFGTLRLALADTVLDVPLGDQEADMTGPQVKSITFTPPQAVRDAAAQFEGDLAQAVIEGKALDGDGLVWVAAHCGPDGRAWATDMLSRVEVKAAGRTHRINTGDMNLGKVAGGDRPKLESIEDLCRAVDEHGNCPAEDRPARVRKLKRRAHELGASSHVHERIDSLGGGKSGADDDIEVKVMSPSPNAAKLRSYWAHGEGRAKWNPGTPGDFKRLRRKLRKYVKNPKILDGLTANIHKLATGEWPGKNAHTGKKMVDWSGIEVKAFDLLDEVALHEGVEDWGSVFDEEWAHEHLIKLDAADTSDEDDADAGVDLGRFAAIGATLVADPGPAVQDAPAATTAELSDQGSGESSDAGWANLFDDAPAPVSP